ncbi:Ubiquitinconjugating enzyme subfamily protein [Acanthamoeba castellanii str. Neff]|uniref:Ubiquitinconjugating enzyme subfamily protein n=1 Tax=Acanthamoeba castellanii (strain ATCC 30010 / Neff) TaxID=1257118 RepID=L8GMM6_ACACF|nr:Ubiquitinconjugating enzyme subfamily protein [Acanthamoeba castellanii str. Neff]ELR14320.1 Ubiquitinconjugating enzyme subfamily protein [Acanthamoeba castellanii str. Neff]
MEERDDAQATPAVEGPGNDSTTHTTNPSSSTPTAYSAGAAEKGQLKIDTFVEEKYAPYLREYTVLIEYKQLPQHVPSGVFVLPSLQSLFEWHGVMFIRQGLYKKGVFKFVLSIPEAYPDAAPTLRFVTPVFHPLVSAQGEVDLTRAFPRWVAYRDQIWCVLAHVKKLFYHIQADNPLNADAAAKFLAADASEFEQSAVKCVEDSLKDVYINPTDSSLRFAEWNQHFENLRNYILEKEDENEGIISWVSKGVSKIINIRY